MRFNTVVVSAIFLGACCKPAVAPPATTSSSSIGIITVEVGGKQTQKLYLPQGQLDANGQPTIAVLDAAWDGHTGSPVLASIELTNHADQSLATAASAGDGTVVAIGYESIYVDFIDPTTDTVTQTVELPQALQSSQSSFSGGGGLVTGVVVDPVKHRAILAVAQGFISVDLTTHQFGALVQAAPSENFGFWPDKGWALAPFYDCPATSCSNSFPSSGFQIVDMNAGKSYLVTSSGGTTPLSNPDSADIDPSTGMVVVPDEGDFVFGINLNGVSPSGTSVVAPVVQSKTGGPTAVAIDSTQHRALLEFEALSSVGILQLPTSAANGPVTLGQASYANMPNLPDGSGWQNAGDPHGLAVTVGLLSGAPVGFVAHGSTAWVARIDLDGFAALPADSSQTVSQNDFSKLVTLIPATKAP
ncbi:MAG: hypothetical protein ACYCWW_06070 [Deltaproteobacteria bacterium]